MKSFLFFVEGIHDINCVAKILLMNGFKEIHNMNNLPKMWKIRIPRVYPFVDNRLDRFIPIPSYFIKDLEKLMRNIQKLTGSKIKYELDKHRGYPICFFELSTIDLFFKKP